MDIKISKSARVCRACERDFVHEEPVYSLVRVQEKELVREDCCAACWRQERAAEAFSHWSTKYYDPRVAEQGPAEAFSPLRQLFYEAMEAEDRVEQAKAFLAAQLLRRQKVFRQIKESDEADGETKIILFNDRIGNRLIEVRDPNFTYAELEQGRVLLMHRLQELESPPEAAVAIPAAAPKIDGVNEAIADTSASADEADPDDEEAAGEGDEEDGENVEEESDDDSEDDDDEDYDDDDFEDDDDDDEDEEELEEEEVLEEEEDGKKESVAHVQ